MRPILATLFCCIAALAATAQVNFTFDHYQVPSVTAGVVSGDFNRDGLPDIAAVSNQNPDNYLSVFLGIGGGKFGTRKEQVLTTDWPSQIESADLNHDGELDLVISHSESAVLTVLLGNGDGTFRPLPQISIPYTRPQFVLGNLSNDGRIDLIVTGCTSSSCGVRVLLGNGDGTFRAHQNIQTAGRVGSLHLIDLNRDATPDLASVRAPQALIWLGTESGTLSPPKYLSAPYGEGASALAVADFNNDSSPDVAVMASQVCGQDCGDSRAFIYINNGAASFSLRSQRSLPLNGGELLSADLNGDLNDDLLQVFGGHFYGGMYFAAGQGNGFFGTPQWQPGGHESSDIFVRDMNLDSRHDLLVGYWLSQEVAFARNTSAYTTCAPPGSQRVQAKFCGLTNGQTVNTSPLVTASGNSPAGIVRLEVWIDGRKVYEKWNDQIRKRFTLAPGSHRITVVAVDRYAGYGSATVNVTAQ